MPLDPQAQALLEAMKALGAPDITTLTPEQARQASEARLKTRRRYWTPVAKCQNATVPGPDGPIPVRIYTPAQSGELSALVYFHGGGFVLGSLEGCDPLCNFLADGAGCVVVSVDYRLAPEHKFPAAPQDCLAVTQWVAANARQLHCNPRQIGVGGESAGAALAAVVALAARERGGPHLAFQMLLYPVTDATMQAPSYQTIGEGYFLTRDMMAWFWNHYLDPKDDRTNPFISPLHAKSLQGLPPALVITAEFDPLRDEGEAYGEALRKAGVPAAIKRYPGVCHGFVMMGAKLDAGRQAIADCCAELKKAFGR